MKRLFLVSCLFIALLSLFMVTKVVAEDNLVVNPGFEKDLKGWSEWNSDEGAANGEISTEEFHSGTKSGKRWFIYPTELTYSCFVQELNIAVEKGDVVSFSGWMMSPSDDPLRGGAEAFLSIEFWRGAEKISFPESERLKNRSQWKKFEVSGIVPETTESVKVTCFLFGYEGAKGTVYFDDLKVEIKPKNVPY